MVEWLKQIVLLLAGVICVVALTGCGTALWKSDQMIGVPLETQKGVVIRTARLFSEMGGQYVHQWRYGGLTPDGQVIIGKEFFCSFCPPRDIGARLSDRTGARNHPCTVTCFAKLPDTTPGLRDL